MGVSDFAKGTYEATPYALVYSQNAVLHMERAVNTLRVRKQPPNNDPEYTAAMLSMLENVELVWEGGNHKKESQSRATI